MYMKFPPDLAANEKPALLDGYAYLARYYDPVIGQFTSFDSYQGDTSDPITLNKYLYAGADPVMNVDPSGHDFTLFSELAVVGIGDSIDSAGLGGVAVNARAAAAGVAGIANWSQVTLTPTSGNGQPLSVLLWSGVTSPDPSGLLPWAGATLFQDALVRDWYIKNVGAIPKTATDLRKAIRVRARTISSPVGQGIAEFLQPAANEASRIGGTANKTNAAVNAFYKDAASKLGPALIVVGAGISAYNIYEAPNHGLQLAKEAGGWVGALAVGYAGAEAGLAIGTAVGGPLGGAIGSVAGGIVGAIYGSELGEVAGENDYNFFF